MKIRSTPFTAFKRCPRYYYYEYVRGLKSVHKRKSNHLYFGSALHKAVELFHKKGYSEGLKVWDTYDNEMADSDKNPVIGRILYEMYAKKPLKMISAERAFTIRVGTHEWAGRFDGIVEWNNLLYVNDHKTTKWEFRQLKPNDQFISYFLGGRVFYHEVAGVIINEFNVRTRKIEHKIVSYTNEEVDEWIAETKLVISFIVRCTNSGIFPKTPDCYKYNKECKYRVLCTSTPELAERLIERHFLCNVEQTKLNY